MQEEIVAELRDENAWKSRPLSLQKFTSPLKFDVIFHKGSLYDPLFIMRQEIHDSISVKFKH